jgi:hypothetical protein
MVASMLARFRLAATIAVAAAVVAIGLQASVQPVQAVQSVCATRNCATLSVGATGPGAGTITTDDGGINCVHSHNIDSGVCSEQLVWSLAEPSVRIAVTVTPAKGSTQCPGTSCLDSPATYAFYYLPGTTTPQSGFRFALAKYALTVGQGGTGTGSVTDATASINCPSACSLSADYGTKITLTATPGTGKFKAWTGSCAGQGATCNLTLTADMVTIAEFDLPSAAAPPTADNSTKPTATGSPSATAAAPGSSVLAETASPATSAETTPSPSADASSATSADPSPAAPGGSDSIPWVPLLLLGVLAVAGVTLLAFQWGRSRAPRV